MDQADENAPESMHERYDEERARRRQAQDRRIQELRQPWRRAVQSGVAATPPPAVIIFPRLQLRITIKDTSRINKKVVRTRRKPVKQLIRHRRLLRKRGGYDAAQAPKRSKGEPESDEADGKDLASAEGSSLGSGFATDESEEKEEVGHRRTPPLEVDEASSSPSEFVPSNEELSKMWTRFTSKVNIAYVLVQYVAMPHNYFSGTSIKCICEIDVRFWIVGRMPTESTGLCGYTIIYYT
ncbi:hypothetical protein PHYSODRAFT_302852 [Phytophthora sojae]|uniref:Uncharacterized protein n=1 Tax=Phytophthora sojae (strain P6497) TaxID=1094619 RepID=G4ZT88_PHYSP|nr:hypothetical protein PHYSODRAFT_302852 [Phytophthora sojae]EGZ13120.1 hypothetical protein PHYSODRAFT_302852 [Phytophthora sojae]|eukprot:XP_009530549.1 hypothetical protein PHYSODRAFT_302852 [Phytophthora sojae]